MGVRNFALITCAGLALSASVAMAQEHKHDDGHGHPAQPAPVQPVSPPVTPVQAPADAPRINFEETTHEFGTISDDHPVTNKFKFVNGGKSTLKIGTVQGSCGCTVPELAKKEYEPGESGEITVTYNPANRRGKQHTQVTVNSNDPVTPSLILHVQSEIKPMMYVEPQAVNFGQAPKGKPATVKATIYSRSAELKPTQATCSNPNVTATLGATTETKVGDDTLYATPIEISASPAMDLGPIVANVTLRTSEASRLVNIQVGGEVVGDFAVAPNRVQFLNVQPNAPLNLSLRVASRAGKDFKILGVEEVPMGLKTFSNITFTPVPDSKPMAYTVSVTGVAPGGPASFRGDLVVTTDSPDEKTFKIPYNGYVANQQVPQQAQTPRVDPWVANPSSLVPSK